MSLMNTLTQYPALQNFIFLQMHVSFFVTSPQIPFLSLPFQRDLLIDSYQIEFGCYQGKLYLEFLSIVCSKTENLRIIK